MFPLRQNPVASTEHECRDPHSPGVSHTENAEEEGEMCGFGVAKKYSVYRNHHDDSSGATESQRQGRNQGNQQVHTAGVGVRRGGATFQPEDGGDTPNWIYCKTRSTETRGSPEQSDRNSIPTKTGDGEDVPDQETVGSEPGASRSMKTGQKKKRLLGGINKEKQQSNKDVTVQCIDFCEVLRLMCMRF